MKYTVNVELTAEEAARLSFLAGQRKTSRRFVAYALLAEAIAQEVLGDATMRRKYDEWQRTPAAAHE